MAGENVGGNKTQVAQPGFEHPQPEEGTRQQAAIQQRGGAFAGRRLHDVRLRFLGAERQGGQDVRSQVNGQDLAHGQGRRDAGAGCQQERQQFGDIA